MALLPRRSRERRRRLLSGFNFTRRVETKSSRPDKGRNDKVSRRLVWTHLVNAISRRRRRHRRRRRRVFIHSRVPFSKKLFGSPTVFLKPRARAHKPATVARKIELIHSARSLSRIKILTQKKCLLLKITIHKTLQNDNVTIVCKAVSG